MPAVAPPTAVPSLRDLPLPEPGGRLRLDDVSWEDYRRLSDEAGNSRLRLTYDRGRLEIEMPSKEHDDAGRLATLLLFVFAEERELPLHALGSTTQQSPDELGGLEPDESYYLRNSRRIFGKRRIDLNVDPPPDLCVEIDIRRPRRMRDAVYARLGVPEVWQWRRGRLRAMRLEGGEYAQVPESVEVPGFPLAVAAGILARWPNVDQMAVTREFRQWCRAHPPQIGGGAVG